jgi:hypothetical protein
MWEEARTTNLGVEGTGVDLIEKLQEDDRAEEHRVVLRGLCGDPRVWGLGFRTTRAGAVPTQGKVASETKKGDKCEAREKHHVIVSQGNKKHTFKSNWGPQCRV